MLKLAHELFRFRFEFDFFSTTISKLCQNVVFKNPKVVLKNQNLNLNIRNFGLIIKLSFDSILGFLSPLISHAARDPTRDLPEYYRSISM